jgi:hypothetical protein
MGGWREVIKIRDSTSIGLAVSGAGTFLTGMHAAVVNEGGGFHRVVALLFVGLVGVHLWLNQKTVVRRLAALTGFVRIGMVLTLVAVLLVGDSTSSHITAALRFTTAVGVHVWLYRRAIVRRFARLGWAWAWIGAGILPIAHLLAE